jgi:hypothetical protein
MNDMAGKAGRATVERIGKMPRYNFTAGVREGGDTNRIRVAGNLDEIQGIVANTPSLFRHGASLLANSFGVGFIDWLDAYDYEVTRI